MIVREDTVLGGWEFPECVCDQEDTYCPVYDWLDQKNALEAVVAFLRWGAGLTPYKQDADPL